MNNPQVSCTCNEDGYTPDCPYAFQQGGKVLHEVVSNDRLKPRYVDRITPVERELKSEPRIFQLPTPNMQPARHSDHSDDSFEEIEMMLGKTGRKNTAQDQVNYQSNLIDADQLLAKNRVIMEKHAPLKIGGNTLTNLSIGGFQVDLGKAAQKASEVVPLPPAKLPQIYIDEEMNFNHHFFQGLERLIGREQVLEIVGKSRHYTNEEPVLLPLIEGIIKVGYEKKDTSLTVFTKSVLSSTFDVDKDSGSDMETKRLLVAANLWGFQYIEQGMECREPDLRMWLSISYDKFRTIFFNTFKDSGMPAFAMEGVQVRYEPVRKLTEIGKDLAANFNDQVAIVRSQYSEEYTPSDSGRSRRSRKSRRQQPPERTIGSLLFGSR
jgi:hypothetical protein